MPFEEGTKIDLTVENMIDDAGWTVGYVMKGHVTRETFEREVQRQYDEDFELGEKRLHQEVMRKIPTPHIDEWAFVYENSKPGRGAFACTVVYLD